MKRDEDPRTDVDKWIQEDFEFGASGGGQEIKLSADDYATWPSHLTQWHFKSLVITGRDTSHTFDLREMLLRHNVFWTSRSLTRKL